jgi:hypothetical protein
MNMIDKLLKKFVKIKDELNDLSNKINFLKTELDFNTWELIQFLKEKQMLQVTDLDDEQKTTHRFINYYKCPFCKDENNNSLEWHDAWDHSCNDRCPECDVETQPYLSEDLGN